MSVSEIPIRLSASRMFAFFELRMAMMLSKAQVLDCVLSLCSPLQIGYVMGSDAICVSVFRWSGGEGLVSIVIVIVSPTCSVAIN